MLKNDSSKQLIKPLLKTICAALMVTSMINPAQAASSTINVMATEGQVFSFDLTAIDTKTEWSLQANQILPTWIALISVAAGVSTDVSTLAGELGNWGSADGTGELAGFYYPAGIFVASDGTAYVADEENDSIRKITPTGVVTTIARSVDGVSNPRDLVLDASGNIIVANATGNNLLKITPAGVVTIFATGISYPSGIDIDSNGDFFVTEVSSNKVKKVTSAGIVSDFAGSGSAGSDNNIGILATFTDPYGLTVDSSDNIFVREVITGDIRKITAAGVVSKVGSIGTTAFGGFMSLTDDAAGNIYIADVIRNVIHILTPSGDMSVYAGALNVSGATNGDIAIARFNRPSGLHMHTDGVLYVSDASHAIRRVATNVASNKLTGTPANNDVNNTGFAVIAEATDGINTTIHTVTVTVANTNDSPTDISLTTASINQSATTAGADVGVLSTTDIDVGDNHTYSLIDAATTTTGGSCTSDSGNPSFLLNTNTLKTKNTLTPGSYMLCVQSVDSASMSFKKDITIAVPNDGLASSNSSTGTGSSSLPLWLLAGFLLTVYRNTRWIF